MLLKNYFPEGDINSGCPFSSVPSDKPRHDSTKVPSGKPVSLGLTYRWGVTFRVWVNPHSRPYLESLYLVVIYPIVTYIVTYMEPPSPSFPWPLSSNTPWRCLLVQLRQSCIQKVAELMDTQVLRSFLALHKGCKQSTSPNGMTFCKRAQLDFPRWWSLGSDGHSQHQCSGLDL